MPPPLQAHYDLLPAAPGPLHGRRLEMAAASNALRRDEVRLLTLTGPGGSGKTRLALALGDELADSFQSGIAFVDLAAVVDPALVIPHVAAALGLREARGQSALDVLRAHLRPLEVLLVLDNLEQVVAAGSEIADLLAECPRVKVLATSREALRLRWERVFPVMPLELPDEAELDDLGALAGSPAIRLFVERAQALRSDFTLSSRNARTVAEICLQLDGLPLAIELAAAHSSALTPQQILGRLKNPLSLLTLGAQDLPSRQRTLRRAIGWSYELLSAEERRLAECLAVFAGGWTLEGAEAICADGDAPIATGLAAIVDKSLAYRDDGDEPRFRMLTTIREFLAERLEIRGAEALRRAHADYFVRMAESAEPELLGSHQSEWLDRLTGELDNLRAALDWALANRDADRGLRLAAALWRFWEVHGLLGEGRARLVTLLAEGGTPATRAKGLQALGHLTFLQGDYPASSAALEESLTLWRRIDDPRGIAAALNGLGLVATYHEDLTGAWSMFQEAAAANREAGARAGEAINLNNLGRVAFYQGELPTARALHVASTAIRRELGDDWGLSLSESDLADVALAAGEVDEAERLLVDALARWSELGSQWGVAYALEGLSGAAAARQQMERAARLVAVATALRRAIGEPASPLRQRYLNGVIERARAALGEDRYQAAWTACEQSTPEESLAFQPESQVTPPPPVATPPASEVESTGPLSRREWEVALLVARGLTNRQIAGELVISERTADAHVARILSKLGFSSRAQVAAWVVQRPKDVAGPAR